MAVIYKALFNDIFVPDSFIIEDKSVYSEFDETDVTYSELNSSFEEPADNINSDNIRHDGTINSDIISDVDGETFVESRTLRTEVEVLTQVMCQYKTYEACSESIETHAF